MLWLCSYFSLYLPVFACEMSRRKNKQCQSLPVIKNFCCTHSINMSQVIFDIFANLPNFLIELWSHFGHCDCLWIAGHHCPYTLDLGSYSWEPMHDAAVDDPLHDGNCYRNHRHPLCHHCFSNSWSLCFGRRSNCIGSYFPNIWIGLTYLLLDCGSRIVQADWWRAGWPQCCFSHVWKWKSDSSQ